MVGSCGNGDLCARPGSGACHSLSVGEIGSGDVAQADIGGCSRQAPLNRTSLRLHETRSRM